MEPVAQFELILILLVAVVCLGLAARWLKFPPAAALIIGGGGLTFVPGMPVLRLNPDLVLVLFLPPLLTASAYFHAVARFPAESAEHSSSCDWSGAVHHIDRGRGGALGRSWIAMGSLFRAWGWWFRHQTPSPPKRCWNTCGCRVERWPC